MGDGDGEGSAGGVYAYTLYGEVEIIGSTISGNSAGVAGGLLVDGLEGSVLVESSTISDNAATFFGGAGTLAAKYELRVRNSTISGNTSGNLNGGIVVYSNMDDGPQSGQTGSERGTPVRNLLIEFTTITDNSASDVGGLGISSDIAFPVTASVIAGNSAATDPDIGFDPGGLGEAEVAFSLVGVDTTSGTIDFDTASSGLLGQDPLLGPLADNGGATFTHLPAATSPLVDVIAPGTAGCGSTVTTDQRGQVRPRGEGCDPGAVEQGVTGPPPAALAVPVLDRIGLLLMAGLLGLVGLFGFRHRSSNKADRVNRAQKTAGSPGRFHVQSIGRPTVAVSAQASAGKIAHSAMVSARVATDEHHLRAGPDGFVAVALDDRVFDFHVQSAATGIGPFLEPGGVKIDRQVQQVERNVVLPIFRRHEGPEMPQRHPERRRRAQIGRADTCDAAVRIPSLVAFVHCNVEQFFGPPAGLLFGQNLLCQPEFHGLPQKGLVPVVPDVVHAKACQRLSIHEPALD